MRLSLWLILPLLGASARAHLTNRNYDLKDYFVIELHHNCDPNAAARDLGVTNEGPLGELPNHYTFSAPKGQGAQIDDTLKEVHELRRMRRKKRDLEADDTSGKHGVLWHRQQTLKKRHVKRVPPPPSYYATRGKPRQPENDQVQQEALQKLNNIATQLKISDPIFKEQWHLFNPIQIGHDMNVTGVWLDGITGNGTTSCIVDDGLDMYSDDLKANYFAAGSWDYNDPGPEPRPRLSDDKHGTRCAGEIAAAKNNICGIGMAYDSKVSAVRILSKPISDEDEALAINYKYQDNHIYSCSWGPPDDGKTMDAPDLLIRKAIVNGIQKGRGGLGSVFIFAAGNGAAWDDNCNFDGYTNSIYSITVGAIDRNGDKPYYSEACSANLVVTYSSGHGDAIHTTDVGSDKCYTRHGGTSAAGPLMVGAAALALSVRPDLGWRDLQYLVVNTAVPFKLDDAGWQTTKIGKKFHHQYGYGKLDTWAFVEATKSHVNVKPQAWYHSPWLTVAHPVPEGDQGLAASFDITKEMLEKANLERLEHVTITMNVNHTRRGDLSVELRSPEGVVSHIATARRNDEARAGYVDWTFMSVAHWGESGVGTWTVIVKDHLVNEHNGTFVDWRLNLWGEAVNGLSQQLHPLPNEHDHDHETATAVVVTTSISASIPPTEVPTAPADHIDRPTNQKPSKVSSSDSAASTSAAVSASSSPSTPLPSASASTSTSATSSSTQEAASATHTVSDSFLPGFFPTFGVSKRTQIWIYGAAGLIIVFCIGLGAYFLVQRRRRLRNTERDDYEFEMVADEDFDDDKAGVSGKGRKRRGGELYDAFAGESDEDVFSDDGSSGRYEDTPNGSTLGGSTVAGSQLSKEGEHETKY